LIMFHQVSKVIERATRIYENYNLSIKLNKSLLNLNISILL